MTPTALPPSPSPDLSVIELTPERESLLQRYFEANPQYHELCNGEPPGPHEARREILDRPPEGWDFTRTWVIGYLDPAGELVAMASLVSDLLAAGVWHVGLFHVATARHGSGLAHPLYTGLEGWALAGGAVWMRLGVLVVNARAERFWRAHGYLETRTRTGVVYGSRTHTLRVLCKPLAGGTLEQYRALIPRDRPED